ncbi:MAG: pyrrolo-quinoline quinone [Planctomycetota bacterium]|nr:MAG: pyrrolo-quinoline quinone [Planctomycetota bacterium]
MSVLRPVCFACFAFVATCLASSSPTAAQSASASVTPELPTSRMLNRYGLERAWWSQATINPRRDKIQYMVLDEENVYLQGTGGSVTAFDAESGKRLWSVQLGNRDEPIFAGVSNDKHFLTISGMTLYCIERFGGRILWELTLPAMPSVGLSVDDQHIYIGALDGSIYSFELKKIDELYHKRLLPQWSYQAMRWRYRTSKEISTTAYSTGRLVNFASRDGSLYAVGALERDLAWQFETSAPITAPLAATNDSLILASEDYFVYCLNRENGLVRWEFASGFPIRKAPVVIEQDLYIMPDRGGMFNLAVVTGSEKWERPGITDLLAASKSRLFGSDVTGNVVLLQRSTGRPLGTLPLRPFSVRLQNDRTDRLFLATPSGLVMCLREQGSEFARYHKYPERSPIVPDVEPDEPTPPVPMPDAAANQ